MVEARTGGVPGAAAVIPGADAADAHLAEERIDSLPLFRGRFLDAHQDTVRLPDGRTAVREYVVHPGAAVIVPLLDTPQGLQVVLERQFRYPMGRVVIEFPAGKRDGDERTFDCACRELREETGYTAREWALAGTLHPAIAYSTEFIDVWFARGLSGGARTLDAGEFLDVFTVAPEQLFAWCRDGTVTDAKTLTCALWLQNVRSGAWTLDWKPA